MSINETIPVQRFFAELSNRLDKEHIEYTDPEGDRIPILLNGQEIGVVVPGGGMRVRKDAVDDHEASDLYHKAGAVTAEVYEYMMLMKEAPPLKAVSLSDTYKLLADFNGYVLGGMDSKRGVQFTTWQWAYDKAGLTLGHYCGNDYAAAKRDFALRSGLVQEQEQFTPEQLIEIYRCCADTLVHDYELTYEQERRIEGIQNEITEMVPDLVERFKQTMEQEASSQQMQQTM